MVQKPKGDGGLGAALGGGSMEAALGAESGSLLTKITIYAVIGFFVLTFALYLGNLATKKAADAKSNESRLSGIAGEPEVGDSGTDVTAESALQQVLQVNEETTGDTAAGLTKAVESATAELDDKAETAIGDLVDEVESAAEAINPEAEEAENP